jgi:hydrogenase maturation protein HypF
MEFILPLSTKKTILALGAESAGNFSVVASGKIYFFEAFGDLLEEANFSAFKKAVLAFLRARHLRPEVVLADLHPLYATTIWGGKLAKRFRAEYFSVQHHLAHIFSAVGEKTIVEGKLAILDGAGIALDGTGLGLDGRIWGGEVFELRTAARPPARQTYKLRIERIGHLENQSLVGGEQAIREPARMLAGILNKLPEYKDRPEAIFHWVEKYYSRREFEVLFRQMREGFNCPETSSTGRVLDAVAVLLGFADNKREYKHGPIDLLEKNSGHPYALKPVLKGNILLTAPLFQYLLDNFHKDKSRLAATAQVYIAAGLHKLIREEKSFFLAGGIASNKFISSYLEVRGAYTNKKIPRGDAGLSFGQIFYYLLANPRN